MAITLQTSYSSAPAIGYEGQLDASNSPDGIITMKNVEASASIAFGRAVVFKTSSPASDKDVLLPAAETDKVAGIVCRSHAYEPVWTDLDGNSHGSIDSNGVKPGHMLNVLRRGRILVKCEDGCVPGDRLWVRAVGSTPPEYLGGLNSADDSTDMVDCTKQGVWLTTASAEGLAWLEVDFTTAP